MCERGVYTAIAFAAPPCSNTTSSQLLALCRSLAQCQLVGS